MQILVILFNFDIKCSKANGPKMRKNNAYCEVLPWAIPTTFIPSKNPVGIVLSSGLSSVNEELVFRQPSLN